MLTIKQNDELMRACVKRSNLSGGTSLFWYRLALEQIQRGTSYKTVLKGLQ